MVTTTDVLVIGGGIAGISAAARLAPDASVIVLERESAIGTHSTGRSAATFILNYGNATLRALNSASEAFLIEQDVLTKRGQLELATEAQLDDLEVYLGECDGLERLNIDEALKLVPALKADQFKAAAYASDAKDLDVDRVLQGFVRALTQAGGKIVSSAPIHSMELTGTVWNLETAAGSFEAPVVINAAGAWADEIAKIAGIRRIGLSPCRRSVAILPVPDDRDVAHWPLVGSLDETWYAKPQSGKLLVSPADEDPVPPMDAWPDDMVLAEGLDRFEQAMDYAVTRVDRTWAGLRSFVADRTPVAGFSPDSEGFFWLAGQGGYGIQTSPALSQLAADLILKRPTSISGEIVEKLSPGREGIGPRLSFG